MLNVSKSFFKQLEKLKGSTEYAEALREDGTLMVQSHQKRLYRLFLDNTTGDVTSRLRTALTARESFKVWLEPTLAVRVQKQTYTQQ